MRNCTVSNLYHRSTGKELEHLPETMTVDNITDLERLKDAALGYLAAATLITITD
jgi:hypothetical protein